MASRSTTIEAGRRRCGRLPGADPRGTADASATDRKPYAACTFPRPTASCGRWASRRCEDRVVQMAALLILEPIFEADFLDCSFGFRPGRSAHQALEAIAGQLAGGLSGGVRRGPEGLLRHIPHDKLMACLEMRIADRSVLKLIRMWLEAPVVEPRRNSRRAAGGVVRRQGNAAGRSDLAAAGEPLSCTGSTRCSTLPDGPAQWAKAKLVRYADDFVVMARYQGPAPQQLHRREVGSLDGTGDQPGEDARGEPAGGGSEPGLPGLHVSV